MTAAELGKQIKEARLAKKMTQAEVVGTFITRNMLSQIESGAAMPSIKTLHYLAQVLDLPQQQLLHSEPAPQQDALEQLQAAKSALATAQYAAVPDDETLFPACIQDELYALAARACLSRARSAAQNGEPQEETIALTRRAIDYAGKGLYANEALRSEAVLYLNEQVRSLSASL